MDEKEVYSLFSDRKEENTENDTKKSRKYGLKPTINYEFIAKRNASKIAHYFVNARHGGLFFIGILIFSLIFLLSLILLITKTNKFDKDALTLNFIQAMISVQYLVKMKIDRLVLESNFFSGFLSDIFSGEAPLVTLDKNNIREALTVINNARNLSKYAKFWWDVGLKEGGQLFGIEASESGFSNPLMCVYGYTKSRNESGTLVMTKFDGEKIPENFPEEYLISLPYSLYNRPWYRSNEGRSDMMWTNPYLLNEKNPKSEILISVITPMTKETGFSGLVSISFNTKYLKQIISSMNPSLNSRVMIVNKQYNIIAMNKAGNIFEVWNQTIIMNNMRFVDDEVWKEVANNEMFITKKNNFMFKCRINGELKSYVFGARKLERTPHNPLTLFTAICVSDFITEIEHVKIVNYTLSAVLVIFAWAFTFIYMVIDAKKLSSIQNQIMNEPEPYPMNSNESKIMQSTEKLLRIFSHQNRIVKNVTTTIKFAKYTTANYFYNPQKIIVDIDKEMKSLLQNKYRIIDLMKFSDIKVGKQRMSDVEPSNLRVFNQSVYEGNKLRVNDFILEASQRTLRTEKEDQIEFIINFFVKVNSDLLFDKEKLTKILRNYLKDLDPKIIAFAADSFDFLCFIISNNMSIALKETDLALCLMIALFIWHISMRERTKPQEMIQSRYVVTDKYEGFIVGDSILSDLKEARLDMVVYDINRWESIDNITTMLIETFFVKEQLYSIRILERIVRVRYGSMLRVEEINLMQVILSLAEYSYIFHEKGESKFFTDILRDGIKEEDSKSFENSVITEIIVPCVRCLRSFMDTTQFEEMINSFK